MDTASIAVVASGGVEPLRATLQRIRSTVDRPYELIVLADQHSEDVITYLTRHYLSGDVAAIGLEASGDEIHHCGLDHAFHLASGEVLVRIEDDLLLEPGWFDAVLETLAEHEEIGMLGLVQQPEKPRRGRPPKRRRAPEPVEVIDLRGFATRRSLFGEHEAALSGEKCTQGCLYQNRLRDLGRELAYLPGQVRVAGGPVRASASLHEFDGELPSHDGVGGTMGQLKQVYQLCEEVLVPCMTCGDNELVVLAAQVEFCATHGVPIGYLYTLRCTECDDVQYVEDYQFRCPD